MKPAAERRVLAGYRPAAVLDAAIGGSDSVGKSGTRPAPSSAPASLGAGR